MSAFAGRPIFRRSTSAFGVKADAPAGGRFRLSLVPRGNRWCTRGPSQFQQRQRAAYDQLSGSKSLSPSGAARVDGPSKTSATLNYKCSSRNRVKACATWALPSGVQWPSFSKYTLFPLRRRSAAATWRADVRSRNGTPFRLQVSASSSATRLTVHSSLDIPYFNLVAFHSSEFTAARDGAYAMSNFAPAFSTSSSST